MARRKKSEIDAETLMLIHHIIIGVSIIISIVCFYGIVKLIQYIDNRYPDKKPITVLFSIFLISVYIYGVYFLFIHII